LPTAGPRCAARKILVVDDKAAVDVGSESHRTDRAIGPKPVGSTRQVVEYEVSRVVKRWDRGKIVGCTPSISGASTRPSVSRSLESRSGKYSCGSDEATHAAPRWEGMKSHGEINV
jgi:hypothetical protein